MVPQLFWFLQISISLAMGTLFYPKPGAAILGRGERGADMLASQIGPGPGILEIEAPGDGIHIDDLPGEIEPGMQFTFHGLEVDFLQGHSPCGDKFLFEWALPLYPKGRCRELLGQVLEFLPAEFRPTILGQNP